MPNVIIVNLKSKIIQSEDKREKMLDVLLSGTDWMHACGGKGKCTTCKAKILKGMDQMTPHSESEERFLKLNKLRSDERLTCQTSLIGDVTVEVPKETQLPHLTYIE